MLSHSSNFIFHATDPVTNEIVDFDEFFEKLQGRDGGQNKEADLIARLSDICPVEKITVSSSNNGSPCSETIAPFSLFTLYRLLPTLMTISTQMHWTHRPLSYLSSASYWLRVLSPAFRLLFVRDGCKYLS